MKNLAKLSIGKIVAADYRTAAVFKAYNIDFCCNGSQTLEEACERKKIDPEKLTVRLRESLKMESHDTFAYDFWPMDLLAYYIENKHHRYARGRIPVIMRFLSLLTKKYGDRHPELPEVKSLFIKAAHELTAHMRREELILFPYIRKMVKNDEGISLFDAAHFDPVRKPILQMISDHEKEGARFRQIASLTNNYSLPADACDTYKVTYAFLKEFEMDLQKHIHLENNILFAKALGLDDIPPYYLSSTS